MRSPVRALGRPASVAWSDGGCHLRWRSRANTPLPLSALLMPHYWALRGDTGGDVRPTSPAETGPSGTVPQGMTEPFRQESQGAALPPPPGVCHPGPAQVGQWACLAGTGRALLTRSQALTWLRPLPSVCASVELPGQAGGGSGGGLRPHPVSQGPAPCVLS